MFLEVRSWVEVRLVVGVVDITATTRAGIFKANEAMSINKMVLEAFLMVFVGL